FEQFPGVNESMPKIYSGTSRRSLSGPIGCLVVIVLLSVATGIGAYRLGWFGGSSKNGAKTEENLAVEPSIPSPNANASKENSAGTPVAPVVERATERPAVESSKAPSEEGVQPEDPPRESEGELGAGISKRNEARGSGAVSARSGKRGTRVTAVPKSAPTSVSPQEDVYVPPKLLKAIRSLSPPEALRAYASGVVTLDTAVDESGRVQSATPTSGPKPLYKKAVDTVKEYVYQPATRNGKPVPAHVEVKIQFWYEP